MKVCGRREGGGSCWAGAPPSPQPAPCSAHPARAWTWRGTRGKQGAPGGAGPGRPPPAPGPVPRVPPRPRRPFPRRPESKPQPRGRDRTSAPPRAARRERQGAPQLRALAGGPLSPWEFLPDPIPLSSGLSSDTGSSPSSSVPPPKRGLSQLLAAASVGHFLEDTHYAKYSPSRSPFPHPLRAVPPSALPFPPALPSYPCSHLIIPTSLALSPLSHSIFSHFSPISVSLVCLSISVSLPLSPSSAINFPDWLPGSSTADEPYSFLGLTLSTCPS